MATKSPSGAKTKLLDAALAVIRAKGYSATGALILAKAKHGPEVAAACLDHLRRYLETLFHASPGPRVPRPAMSSTI